MNVWNKPSTFYFQVLIKTRWWISIDAAGISAFKLENLPSLKVLKVAKFYRGLYCKGHELAPHHTNVSKIQWLHRAISLLILNKSHSNLASSPILRHSFSCVHRSSLTGPNQKLKNTVELGFITYYMVLNSSWNSWWYCSSLQLFCTSSILSGPRPDLDPDVVAALDDALDLNDPDNVLDDDFIIKVTTIHGIDMSL